MIRWESENRVGCIPCERGSGVIMVLGARLKGTSANTSYVVSLVRKGTDETCTFKLPWPLDWWWLQSSGTCK